MTAVADLTVQFDAEGFMTDPNEWTPEIAAVLAQEEGIDALTDEHWTLHKLKSLPEGAGELSRSLDVFLLQAALQQHEKVPSVGEQRFTLDHWPDLAGASESIDSLRVAGALSRQAHSVRSAAELLALDESVVNAHFWAFKSGGLLNVAGVTQPVARAKPSSSRVQPGFFARLAAHFGLSR